VELSLKGIMKVAAEQGVTVTTRRSGHLCWTFPDGRKVFASGTPGDKRSLRNMIRDLRRYGLVIE